MVNTKTLRSNKRKIRTRSKIQGTQIKPRMSVYRSNATMYVQLIDDAAGKTILGFSEKHLAKHDKMPKTEKAKALGLLTAQKALEKKITTVVFDRGSYAFHGRVKAVAEGAREGGLQF
ncbi:MAG: 50S ribosomal protein L18 [Candidatus Levybacteria bacterium]|nr:50S ribosomal protein L18 [Candidatus Levybacteria bacterium]